jgi:hypothetical protein
MARGIRGWFVAAALSAGAGFGVAAPAVLEPTIAQARAGTAKVACVQQQGLESFVVTLRKPRTCIFHSATAPFDSAHEVPVVKIRWTGWGQPVVHGRGTFRGNMDFKAPATIVLSRARPCGKNARLYTRARITFSGRTTTVKLPSCSG